MKRLRSSTSPRIQSFCMQNRRVNDDTINEIHSILHTERVNLSRITKCVLVASIHRVMKGIWYRILSINNDELDDLASAVGQDWESLLPILVTLKLVKQYEGKFRIVKKEWDLFCLGFDKGFKLHFEHYQPRRGLKQWFVCYGRPTYNGPGKQIRACANRKFAYAMLPYNSSQDIKQKQNIRMLNNIIHSTVLLRNEEINSTTTQSNVDAIDNEAIDLTQVPTDTTILSKTKSDISFALQLDLRRRPRLSRSGATEIKVHERKQATELERIMIMFTAKRWGWNSSLHTNAEDQRIARASCRQIAYDYGFQRELAKFQLYKWEKQLNRGIQNGKEGGKGETPLSRASAGSKKGTLHATL